MTQKLGVISKTIIGQKDHVREISIDSTDHFDHPLLKLSGKVVARAFDDKAMQFAALSSNGQVSFFDPANNDAPHHKVQLEGVRSFSGKAIFSSSLQRLATYAPGTSAIKLWDLATGKPLKPLPHIAVLDIIPHPGGHYFASTSKSQIILWNINDRSFIKTSLAGIKGRIKQLSFSPNGRHFVSVFSDKTVRVWQAGSKNKKPKMVIKPKRQTYKVVVSNDGKRVITVARGQWPRLWGPGWKEPVILQRNAYDLLSATPLIALSPDGQHVAVDNPIDKSVALFNLQSGTYPQSVLSGPEVIPKKTNIRAISFANDNHHLLVSLSNNRILALRLSPDKGWETVATFKGRAPISATVSQQKMQMWISTITADKKRKTSSIRLWRFFRSQHSLTNYVKFSAIRCLTLQEREAYSISSTIPNWCKQSDKWTDTPAN